MEEAVETDFSCLYLTSDEHFLYFARLTDAAEDYHTG